MSWLSTKYVGLEKVILKQKYELILHTINGSWPTGNFLGTNYFQGNIFQLYTDKVCLFIRC